MASFWDKGDFDGRRRGSYRYMSELGDLRVAVPPAQKRVHVYQVGRKKGIPIPRLGWMEHFVSPALAILEAGDIPLKSTKFGLFGTVKANEVFPFWSPAGIDIENVVVHKNDTVET